MLESVSARISSLEIREVRLGLHSRNIPGAFKTRPRDASRSIGYQVCEDAAKVRSVPSHGSQILDNLEARSNVLIGLHCSNITTAATHTLNVNLHYRIVLPPEFSKLKLGMTVTDRLGNSGDEVAWPTTVDKDGDIVDLSKVGGPCDETERISTRQS